MNNSGYKPPQPTSGSAKKSDFDLFGFDTTQPTTSSSVNDPFAGFDNLLTPQSSSMASLNATGNSADPFLGLAAPAPATTSSTLQGKVLYNYTPQAANQMPLKAGTTIRILTKGEAGGWSKGEDNNGTL